EFRRKYGLDAMTHAIIIANYWRDGHYNIRPMAGTTFFVIIIGSCFAFMFFCSFSILRYLSQAKAISTKTRQLQYALFRGLAVQTLIPVVFLHGNASFAIILPIFGVDFSLFCVSCSCFPPFDALAAILLMRDYREAVRSIVMCRFDS
ncbi:hypothetical protein PENTCL1PPCAC_15916, partial [Pristionchus entomophagus]